MPILTLDSIHTHITGVGNPIGGRVRDHLDYPGEYGPNIDDALRSWLAEEGRGIYSLCLVHVMTTKT